MTHKRHRAKPIANSAAPRAIMSVGRALEILELLAGNREGLRLAEFAARLRADRANVLRILTQMESKGFVLKDPVSDRYRLTFLLTALGFRHIEASGVNRLVQPILNHLAEVTRELVRMTVLQNGTLRWVAQAQGANSQLIVDPIMGKEVVLHATATGKVWLATLPEEEAVRLVRRQGFLPQTPATIKTTESLVAELARVRARGYGTVVDEAEVGILAVAAAIWAPRTDGTRSVVGTVSVAGPAPRVTAGRLDEWANEVIRAATVIGETWGPYVANSFVAS